MSGNKHDIIIIIQGAVFCVDIVDILPRRYVAGWRAGDECPQVLSTYIVTPHSSPAPHLQHTPHRATEHLTSFIMQLVMAALCKILSPGTSHRDNSLKLTALAYGPRGCEDDDNMCPEERSGRF